MQDGKAVATTTWQASGLRLIRAEGSLRPGPLKLGENGCLFAPQGGLRIRDARSRPRRADVLNGGTLDGGRLLSPQSVETMLARLASRRPKRRYDKGFYCAYGLAVQLLPAGIAGCKDDPIGDGIARVGHGGDAYGLRSGLWLDRASGTGVAFFVTGLSDDPARGWSAFRAAEEAAFRKALQLSGGRCSMRRQRTKAAAPLPRCRYAEKVSFNR